MHITQHQNNMAALRAELALAVGMAVYRKHWPFDVCDPDEDFLSDEHCRVNKGALVLYRYHEFESDCLRRPLPVPMERLTKWRRNTLKIARSVAGLPRSTV